MKAQPLLLLGKAGPAPQLTVMLMVGALDSLAPLSGSCSTLVAVLDVAARTYGNMSNYMKPSIQQKAAISSFCWLGVPFPHASWKS